MEERRARASLPDFPGQIPDDLVTAYQVQDIAISQRHDHVVGWKVGYIAAERRDTSGDERLLGPIFSQTVWNATGGTTEFPVFVGGFGAVEAEFASSASAIFPVRLCPSVHGGPGDQTLGRTPMITRRRFLGAGPGAAAAPWLGAGATTPIPGGQLLTATDVHLGDYPTVEAVRWFGKQLEERTNGRLKLRQYHSGQLGRESEAIDMARFGAIDITRVYSGALNNTSPLTQALCLPYVFDSVLHLRRAIDGHVGDSVLRSFEQRDLVGLAIYDSGARCFYNTKRPLHRPEDLKGLKLRVASSDIFLKLMRMLGANPTPMSLGETFSAMETHMIDGAENNMRSFQSSRHFEAAHY